MRGYPIFVSGAIAALLSLTASSVNAQQAYDVIVVGSGPGGLVAAEYLSRDSSVSVLILEAGLPSLQATGGADVPDYAKEKGWTQYDIPGEYEMLSWNSANQRYRADWFAENYTWLGKLVGGCSSINAQLYFRTPDSYVTNMKWPFSPDRVQALYDENEQIISTTDKPSADGNWYLQEGYNIVANAFRKNGYSEKTINDRDARNNKDKTFGHAPFTIKNGLRDAPAKSFWNKMKSRSNVKLVTSATVSYIKQSQGKATGVVYNSNVEMALTARGAVLMAAGALSSPKVLIQSGIGPKDQLDLLWPRSDFPGVKQSWVINNNVGKNLFDTTMVLPSFTHPDMKSFQYKTYPSWALDQYMSKGQSGPWASFGPLMIGYENYQVNGRMYEFQTTLLPNGFGDSYYTPNAFTTSLYINNPESRDYSHFTADGKWSAFTGKLNMATANDLAAMQSYTNKVVDMMQANGAKFVSAANGQSVSDWVNSHRDWATQHFGGSCYASADAGDSKRCADEKLRVIGTQNIFMADASTMRDGTVNPYGFIMYIGREAASQVKDFVTGGVVPTAATCSIEEGIEYIGNDVGSAPSSSAEGCCALCNTFSGCKAFTWSNYNGGTCWFKSAKGATKADPALRSSVLNAVVTPPSSTCSLETDVDYIGNDVGSALSAKAEGCCAICKSFSGCNAFTWTNYNGGTCWLKSGKGATKTTVGVRSSVVNSVTTPPPAVSACSTIEENTDYSAPDVGNAPSATAEGCCVICTAQSGCGAYTWTNYNGGTCWLKSYRGTKKSTAGARSAVVNSAPKCSLENDVDYADASSDLANGLSKTATGCCDMCRGRSGCKAFTWTNYNGGTCWLKTAAMGGQAKAGSVSGAI